MIKDNYEYVRAGAILNEMAKNCCTEAAQMQRSGIDAKLALDVVDAASQKYAQLFDNWNDYRRRQIGGGHDNQR